MTKQNTAQETYSIRLTPMVNLTFVVERRNVLDSASAEAWVWPIVCVHMYGPQYDSREDIEVLPGIHPDYSEYGLSGDALVETLMSELIRSNADVLAKVIHSQMQDEENR